MLMPHRNLTLFRRVLASSLLVLVAVTPKMVHVFYVMAYLDNYGTSPVDSDNAQNVFMHTPMGVLGCALAWKLWQRGFGGTSCTTSIFLATVSLAATVTLSAQMDAIVFHMTEMHSFRIKDDCRLIEDNYGFIPGLFVGNVRSSVKNTAAAVFGLDCASTNLDNFRSRIAFLAEEYVSLQSVSAEWGDFLLLVCFTGFFGWLTRSCLRRILTLTLPLTRRKSLFSYYK
jgi:hypothetical protein